MNKKLMALLLCLVLIVSLVPAVSLAADEELEADEVWVYSPVDNQEWKTDTDYSAYDNLYYLMDGEYYEVVPKSADMYSLESGHSWSLTNAPGKYYKTNDTQFGVVRGGNGPLYTKVSGLGHRDFSDGRDHVESGKNTYGIYSDYFYKYDTNKYGRVYGMVDAESVTAHFNGYLYYYNADDGQDPNPESGEIARNGEFASEPSEWTKVKSKFTLIKNIDTVWGNPRDYVTFMWGGNPSVLGDYYSRSTDQPNHLEYDITGNGPYEKLPGSSLKYETGTNPILYTGDLYSKDGTGTSYLQYRKPDGLLEDFCTSDNNGKHSLIKGDTIYTGTLYKRTKEKAPKIKTNKVLGGKTTIQEQEAEIDNPDSIISNDEKLVLDKKLSYSSDNNNYTITMDSFALNNERKSSDDTVEYYREKLPTDFVVIVDQSGSMNDEDMPAGGYEYAGTKNLEDVAAGKYYYTDSYGKTYRVYAKKGYLYEYFAENAKWAEDVVKDGGMQLSWFQGNTDASYTVANQYYYKTNDGIYRPVTVSAQGKLGTYYVKLRYKDASGNDVYFNRGSKPVYHNVLTGGKYSSSNFTYGVINAAITGIYNDPNAYTFSQVKTLGIKTGMYINYPMYKRHVGYTQLCYRDINGEEHVINSKSGVASAEYCNSAGNAVMAAGSSSRIQYDGLLVANDNQSRLTALRNALTDFATAVANETNSDGSVVDNKIAIVGFSSEASDNRFTNTEILTGTNLTIHDNNGVQKRDANAGDYSSALVESTDGTAGNVNSKVSAAINAISADGGTRPDEGFSMAKEIISSRQTKKYTFKTGDKEGVETDRNVVVIFFTDGEPGDFPYSNRYYYANKTVNKAHDIKALGDYVSVFSIGVFGVSDGDPLTYAAHKESSEKAEHTYDEGWMDTVIYDNPWPYNDEYYYLNRGWLPSYGGTANDTIFDYMSTVSSNHPSATSFVQMTTDEENGVPTYGNSSSWFAMTDSLRGANPERNDYYRMASDQGSLVEAFEQAVTYASQKQISSSEGEAEDDLDGEMVFKDAINTTLFDVSNAVYKAELVPIKVNTYTYYAEDGSGDSQTLFSETPVPKNGQISISNYDYYENRLSFKKTEGYKLRVTVSGLIPKQYSNNAEFTNSSDGGATEFKAGVFEKDGKTAVLTIDSPTLKLSREKVVRVVDFNAKMILAENVAENGISNATEKNGSFGRTGDKAYYQLRSGIKGAMEDTQENKQASTVNADILSYSGVDTATIRGNHIDPETGSVESTAKTKVVTVVPASSVYIDDDLTDEELVVGDGHGYSASVESTDTQGTSKTYNFTFTGSAVDLYVKTYEEGYLISTALFEGDYSKVSKETRVTDSASSIKAYSSVDIHNVPVAHLECPYYGTFTLRISTVNNRNFELDGIRVYGAVNNQSDYEETTEKDANYFNLRQMLLNDGEKFGLLSDTEVSGTAISGVLFIDNAQEMLATKTPAGEGEDPEPLYETQFGAYTENGPKNEIYLVKGNTALIFKLNHWENYKNDAKVWIGLSAPKGGSGTVYINNKPQKVSSTVDMYYPVEVSDNGTVKIEYPGTSDGSDADVTMISITNLKITGTTLATITATGEEETGEASGTNSGAKLNALKRMAFAPVTTSSFVEMVNDGADGEDVPPTEDPNNKEDNPAVTTQPSDNDDSGEDGSADNNSENSAEPGNQEGAGDSSGQLVTDVDDATDNGSDSMNGDQENDKPENDSDNQSGNLFNSIQKMISNLFSRISKIFSRMG